jgi:anti-sigma factor RsiW
MAMMNCDQIRDGVLDLAAHKATLPADVTGHLDACPACAERLAALRSTMAVLDEWTAPEPSAYFDSRLQARLREVMAEPRPWWQELLRPVTGWKPAMAMSLVAVLAVGVGLYMNGVVPPVQSNSQTQTVSAVSDLERLDQDQDVLTNFEFVDDSNAGSDQ